MNPKVMVAILVPCLFRRMLSLGKELAAFGAVVKQMLEDVQQRLTFKAQASTCRTPYYQVGDLEVAGG